MNKDLNKKDVDLLLGLATLALKKLYASKKAGGTIIDSDIVELQTVLAKLLMVETA